MEAGNLLLRRPIVIRIFNPKQPPPPPSLPPRLPSSFPPSFRVSSDLQRGYRGPKPRREWVADWVSRNDDAVRSLPIYVGAVSLLAVLVNRGVSGIAPVANASSSQSRADLLTLGLAVTNILAGLVWLSIRPKTIVAVSPQGVECLRLNSHLPDFVISELIWIWESLSAATCCRSLAIVYDSKLILQTGVAASSSANDREAVPIDASTLMQGALYRSVLDSGSQSYLANLSLYPGKSELPFLPPNMQAVILQPLGDKGIAIIGGDTIRGFTTSDQAWISLLGDKLDATLTKCANNLAVAVQDRD
ncbi:protein COFACTOR ASSEMBLY OF COMPLEX C SUBUNIT B CCB4, chloroplastic-like isoform X3 [Rhododendron vialii]|uniref:protein COFACTOR ASSEMBLY OF COMPLEX C SUBUNIT B CCB4, chloroplastic-like isoform X3 n=1 Tax=Rhododendron vialii TaxID=182163 RepID=UPI00265E964C|nr:protein COFACTOR ASSEMBLY OF COMPLEX C SUBUNIT B CCB4, chloroplastic-like isoform X3 [Rhododendron vialii]